MKKRVKILIIDDDELLQLIKSTFDNLGKKEELEVEICTSVEQAVKAIGEHRPTHLFLDDDFGRPENGLIVARQLQSQSRRLCQIFSTTGTRDEEILAEYRKLKIPCVGKGGMVSEIKRILKVK